MNNNKLDVSPLDTPFSQSSFEYRSGNDIGDRSFVMYDVDTPNTPFTPGSFVYRSGKDLNYLVNGPQADPQLETPNSGSPLIHGNFNYRPENDVKPHPNKRKGSSTAVEYSSSFAYQNFKNKHKYPENGNRLNDLPRQRPNDLRVRSYLDQELSNDERRNDGINNLRTRRQPSNRPISITFDGGIVGNCTTS